MKIKGDNLGDYSARLALSMPRKLLEKLDPEKTYSLDEIITATINHFDGVTIEDIAILYLDHYKKDFERRKEKTYNLQEFFKRELKRNSDDIEAAGEGEHIYSYVTQDYARTLGYGAAIDGINPTVISKLNDFSQRAFEVDITNSTWLNIERGFSTLRYFAEGYAHAMMARYIREQQDNGTTPASLMRLKWKGTPAQFGFIIQELIGKGYLERPTNSYSKDAEYYLKIFDIDTKPSTLAKEISAGESQNSLSPSNRAMFKIPEINKLK